MNRLSSGGGRRAIGVAAGLLGVWLAVAAPSLLDAPILLGGLPFLDVPPLPQASRTAQELAPPLFEREWATLVGRAPPLESPRVPVALPAPPAPPSWAPPNAELLLHKISRELGYALSLYFTPLASSAVLESLSHAAGREGWDLRAGAQPSTYRWRERGDQVTVALVQGPSGSWVTLARAATAESTSLDTAGSSTTGAHP